MNEENDILDSQDEVVIKSTSKVQNFTLIGLLLNAAPLMFSLFFAVLGSDKGWPVSERELGIFGSIVFGVSFVLALISFRMHPQKSRAGKIALTIISLIPVLAILFLLVVVIFD